MPFCRKTRSARWATGQPATTWGEEAGGAEITGGEAAWPAATLLLGAKGARSVQGCGRRASRVGGQQPLAPVALARVWHAGTASQRSRRSIAARVIAQPPAQARRWSWPPGWGAAVWGPRCRRPGGSPGCPFSRQPQPRVPCAAARCPRGRLPPQQAVGGAALALQPPCNRCARWTLGVVKRHCPACIVGGNMFKFVCIMLLHQLEIHDICLWCKST